MRPASEPRTAVQAVLAGILLASAVAGAVGPVVGQHQPAGPAFAQSSIDPDAVVMRVDVDRRGDASWAVDFRVRLDDDNATAAFESVAADIDRNASAFTTEFAAGMRRTVASAENRTGREMRLQNVSVSASTQTLPQRYGVVTYRFEWTDFAVVDGERIRAGDSLSGLFLDAESSLVLAWPSGYEATTVAPEPSATGNNSVTWHGPADFGPDTPRVVAEPAASGTNVPLLAAAGLLVVLLIAAAWFVLSRTDLGPGREESAADAGGEAQADAGGPDASAAVGDDAATTGDDDAATTGDDDAAATEPPEELLSNEEKVLRLLEESGGRVKQQQIAGEFDWTDAKTSQVVGTLRDQDEVKTFRIGRENVVTLPEESDL